MAVGACFPEGLFGASSTSWAREESGAIRLATIAYTIKRLAPGEKHSGAMGGMLRLHSVDAKAKGLKERANFGAAVALQDDFLPVERAPAAELAL